MMEKNRVLVTGPDPIRRPVVQSPGPDVRVLSETKTRRDSARTHSETLSEAQRTREVGGAHGHMGPHTMQALSTECLEGEGH